MMADHWTRRAGSIYERGHPDRLDAAHGVQAGVAADRELYGIGAVVDGPDDFSSVASIDRYGAGQRLEAKHGARSCRTWRKLHLAVDATNGMIVAQTLRDQNADDRSQVGPPLDQIDDPILQVTADGAYDGAPTYQTIAAHGDEIEVVIPPRSTAIPSRRRVARHTPVAAPKRRATSGAPCSAYHMT
jgi:hypothetical protein